MLKEGQVRIPSGCSIAAVIAKDGERMSGEKIIGCMTTMHDRNNGLGAVLRHTVFIPTTKTITRYISFTIR